MRYVLLFNNMYKELTEIFQKHKTYLKISTHTSF